MASSILERLRTEMLQLSSAERAELAHELVMSLDAPPDPNAASAWEAEILDRLDAIDSGTGVLVDRDELRRRMRARLSGG
jgi:putative addiction module component (TIGR02574 family)